MKIIINLIISIILIFSFSVAQAAEYIGNKNTLKFHYENCVWLSRMNPKNYTVTNNYSYKDNYNPYTLRKQV